MSIENKPTSSYEVFRSQLPQSDIQIIDLPDDQKELYFRLVGRTIFPCFSRLAQVVARKGSPGASFHSLQTIDRGQRDSDWLSVGIHTPITPQPLSVAGEIVGNSTSHLYVSDTVHSIRFSTLDSGEVVIENENTLGSARILNIPAAVFDEIPSHRLYPAGNPAAWIDKILRREMLEKVEEDLGLRAPAKPTVKALPDKRGSDGSEFPAFRETYHNDVIQYMREIISTNPKYADIEIIDLTPDPDRVISWGKSIVQIEGLGYNRLKDFWSLLNQRLQQDPYFKAQPQ